MSARSHPGADETVERLVELAREAPARDLTPREAAGLHRLERALRGGQRPAGVQRRRWMLAASATVLVAGALALLVHRDRALTYEVTRGTVSEGGYIAAGDAEASLRFSDRSELGVTPGTRVRVSDLQVHGARVMLEGGMLHVRVHHEPKSAWTLDAGPYVVHVTGTEFDLGWRVEDQTFDLRLHKGSVVVLGPLADAGVHVRAGQHLVANGNAGTLSLVDELNGHPSPSDATSAPAPQTADATPAVPAPLPADTTSAAPPTLPTSASSVAADAPSRSRSRDPAAAGRGRAEKPSWNARVARGDFDAVIADAEQHGVETALAESTVADLAALADAARYARRQDLARRALMALRARYAGSVQARDASFFLGGLAESQKDDDASLGWYDVYLGENDGGAYAPQALGRKMMLVQRLKGTSSALPIASEYLARFPEGPYASTAHKLLRAQ